MALATLFPRPGAFEPVDAGGGVALPAGPANPGAMSFSSSPFGGGGRGTSVGGLISGMANTPTISMPDTTAGKVGSFLGLNNPAGLAINAGLALTPFSVANSFMGGLGKLSELATKYGYVGQDTNNPNVTAQLLAPGNQYAGMTRDPSNFAPFNNPNPMAFNPKDPSSPRSPGDEPAPPSDEPTPAQLGELGINTDAPNGVETAAPDAGGSVSGVFKRGGTVKKTGPALVHQDEEVVRASEASRPGVRPLLKAINQPGESPVERGLASVFRRR